MAAHCRYCNSTDIEPLVSPSGINYFHCNECNRNFITPIYDPESVVAAPELLAEASSADAPSSES